RHSMRESPKRVVHLRGGQQAGHRRGTELGPNPTLIAVAINVVLVVSWLVEPRPSKPYVTPFAALAALLRSSPAESVLGLGQLALVSASGDLGRRPTS